jgi:hypothetical protein
MFWARGSSEMAFIANRQVFDVLFTNLYNEEVTIFVYNKIPLIILLGENKYFNK